MTGLRPEKVPIAQLVLRILHGIAGAINAMWDNFCTPFHLHLYLGIVDYMIVSLHPRCSRYAVTGD